MSFKYRLVFSFISICILGLLLLHFVVYSSYKDARNEWLLENVSDLSKTVTAALVQIIPQSKQNTPNLSEILAAASRVEANDMYIFPVEFEKRVHGSSRAGRNLPDDIQSMVSHIARQNKISGIKILYDRLYVWRLNDLSGTPYRFIVLSVKGNTVLQDFLEQYGPSLLATSIIILWIAFWGALIVSSLYRELFSQKNKLELQARALSEAHARAVLASKSKSTFLANMSHEIRTPLTSIIGFADALLECDQNSNDRLLAVQTIRKSGKHVLHVINEILDLSKIEAKKLEIEQLLFSPVNLLKEIDPLMRMQAGEKELHFEINYKFPIPEKIVSDPHRIKQILINLLSNAVKFTEKGFVRVDVSYQFTEGTMHFDIIDSGIGIAKDQCDRIFEGFTQADTSTSRKYGGTGLGLALSKQLAEMLGGTITIASEPGIGSRFSFTLKTNFRGALINGTDQLPTEDDAEPLPVPPIQLEGNILLAEDNADIRRLICLQLNKIGCTVDVVENGAKALEKALHTEYDMVLMDMRMPVMDGCEAVALLRKRGYLNPIYALTANTMKQDQEKCLKAGYDGFLSKPIERSALATALSKHLRHGKTVSKASGTPEPVTSKLLQSDPDFSDIVQKFVATLPDTRKRIQLSVEKQDWAPLREIMHELKGTAGGLGYPALTELAGRVENRLANNDFAEVIALSPEIQAFIKRIMDGTKNIETPALGKMTI